MDDIERMAGKLAAEVPIVQGPGGARFIIEGQLPEGANGVALATMTSDGLALQSHLFLPYQVTVETVMALLKEPSWGKAEVWAIPTRSVERFLVAKAL